MNTLVPYHLESLAACAVVCEVCPRMQHRNRVLGPQNGPVEARVLFIAEAPGRLGADRTGIPLFGDKSGDNFEHLLRSIGWRRESVFITNAVLCNPRSESGLNDTPTADEVRNCSTFLAATIRLIDPDYIVTLGGAALLALSYIVPHDFELSRQLRNVLRWNGRTLIPFYHTGPRAVARRSLLNMESDFQRLKEVIGDPTNPKRLPPTKPRSISTKASDKSPLLTTAVRWLVHHLQPISLFRLHKLLYLAEVEAREVFNETFLNIYFIRQKDGPFAPEVTRVVHALRNTCLSEVWTADGGSYWSEEFPAVDITSLSTIQVQILESIITKFGKLTNRGIKMAAYRRGPMIEIIGKQKAGVRTYNQSLF